MEITSSCRTILLNGFINLVNSDLTGNVVLKRAREARCRLHAFHTQGGDCVFHNFEAMLSELVN